MALKFDGFRRHRFLGSQANLLRLSLGGGQGRGLTEYRGPQCGKKGGFTDSHDHMIHPVRAPGSSHLCRDNAHSSKNRSANLDH